MVISKDISKRLRTIKATLGAGDAGASIISIAMDPNGPASTRDFYGVVEVRSSTKALKPGVLPTYVTVGSSAGIMQIAKGTETFASGDVIVIQGTLA